MRTPSYEQGVQLDRAFIELKAKLNKVSAQRLIGAFDVIYQIAAGEVDLSEIRGRAYSNYSVTVNYDRSVEDGVKAGNYDWVNNDITSEHFPMKRTGIEELSLHLVHFDRNISTEDALKKLDLMGLRPAELQELLSFGENYPDVQREFPIIALGSVWRSPAGYRLVSFLGRGGSDRVLYLGWRGHGWGDVCRGAAVRK
jgi:hypothetical protein